jgi:hypothetical protein
LKSLTVQELEISPGDRAPRNRSLREGHLGFETWEVATLPVVRKQNLQQQGGLMCGSLSELWTLVGSPLPSGERLPMAYQKPLRKRVEES